MSLTELEIRHFREAGYLRLPDLGLPAPLIEETAALIRERSARGAHKVYGLYQAAPGTVHQLVAHPGLTGPLTALLGPNVVYVLNRHNQVSTGAGGRHDDPRLHRDILQPTRGLLTAVIYLEDATVETGCTWVVPGSHRAPYVGVPQPDGGGTWLDEHKVLLSLADQAVPVPVPAGGALLFDGCLFHTNGVNSSAGTRTAAVLGYARPTNWTTTPTTTARSSSPATTPTAATTDQPPGISPARGPPGRRVGGRGDGHNSCCQPLADGPTSRTRSGRRWTGRPRARSAPPRRGRAPRLHSPWCCRRGQRGRLGLGHYAVETG
ncbi:phytanoyl-CoA dioxygenase family protein [Kitasatospora fiedleri]|uniref:phytanoyl-CoA dioxygenase family protein n=1 Tax=Kitasatospora fiedleri TaxID=2991545 RepID=UPI00249ADFD7|nr:phytanoyl-CoA dioxygenase family protein [Kitasatospora fiedleri]